MSERLANRAASDREVSDAALVSRAQQGDSAAFGGLVVRYQHRVYNTCYRMCNNHDDALDLTQSAFLKAFQALPNFDARASFFTWLFRIAVNLTLSQRRARRRRPTLVLRQFDDDERPCEPADARAQDDPSRIIEQTEMQERLGAALDELDDDFRAAVVLRDVEGLNYAAIAEVLELPVGTVKSRIHRGRLMLRALLEQKEPRRGTG
jgi:RNA polymerase sigma-70 factor (ECF subfamily)